MSAPSPYLVWQVADSAFPTGGFAHSGGLEAAWRLGMVEGAAGLERYLRGALEQAGRGALPLVTGAHAAPERLDELDRLYEAMTTNHVARRASRAQGQAWLAAAAVAFARPDIAQLKARYRREGLPGHLAPVFGAVAALVGMERDDAQRLYLFVALRGLVSSAVRLGVVGPMEAQAIQHRLAPAAEAVWERCRALGPDDAAQATPLFDVLQGHHDRLYSRLFSS